MTTAFSERGTIRSAVLYILLAAFSCAAAGLDPLSPRGEAIDLISSKGISEAKNVIARLLSQKPLLSVHELSYLAELMKLTGDPRAPEIYSEAVEKDPGDPGIRWLFGEYWRNFRGPMQPMAGKAEKQFFEAKRKLDCLEQAGQPASPVTASLKRSIVSLYERDGLPLYSWIAKTPCKLESPGVSLFLSTGVRGGEAITDLGVDSDIRELTSAAAYSQSLRLTLGPLSTGLLQQYLRTITPIENPNRLRVRYKSARLDLFFNDRHANNAAITNPYLRDPTPLSNRDLVLYNALKLSELGVSFGDTFHLAAGTDVDLGVTYSRIYRAGLVDYLPNATEDINQITARASLARSVGPDRVGGEFTFVDQSITPENTHYESRSRQIYAGTIRYQIYRLSSGGYSRVFRGTRGLELYSGTMYDHENFGYLLPALVNRRDYFGGATIHGLGKLFDLSVQPTLFTYTVPQDSTRNSRTYRTAAYTMVRLVDEERVGPNLPSEWHGWRLGFVHLTVPIQSDVPLQGLSAFANQKIGAELAAKWFTTDRGGTTFLGSARYDVQKFTNLNRTFSLFTLSLTMGF